MFLTGELHGPFCLGHAMEQCEEQGEGCIGSTGGVTYMKGIEIPNSTASVLVETHPLLMNSKTQPEETVAATK